MKINNLIKYQKENNPPNGNIPGIEHNIKLTSTKPINCKSYPVPQAIKKLVQNIITDLLNKGIIIKSYSPYSSPAFTVGKKNGDRRLVIDYRRLNNITITDQFPIPRIDELLLDLHGSYIFSQIDLNSGFYQINVAKEDQEKTAFCIMNGLYQFTKMPFGATNAPRSFQRAMKYLFGDLQYVKVYLDDLLIHSESLDEHFTHLKEIFDRINNNNISINFNKSNFIVKEVKYLGCIVNQKGIMPDIFVSRETCICYTKNTKRYTKINWISKLFSPFHSSIKYENASNY